MHFCSSQKDDSEATNLNGNFGRQGKRETAEKSSGDLCDSSGDFGVVEKRISIEQNLDELKNRETMSAFPGPIFGSPSSCASPVLLCRVGVGFQVHVDQRKAGVSLLCVKSSLWVSCLLPAPADADMSTPN